MSYRREIKVAKIKIANLPDKIKGVKYMEGKQSHRDIVWASSQPISKIGTCAGCFRVIPLFGSIF